MPCGVIIIVFAAKVSLKFYVDINEVFIIEEFS